MIQFVKDYIPPWVDFLADLSALVGFLFAIYIGIKNRKKFVVFYRVIVGLKNQESLRDLTKRLDQLDRLNIQTKEQAEECRYLFSDILGQLNRNQLLAKEAADIKSRLDKFFSGTLPLAETDKRRICAELREIARGFNYEDITRTMEDS